MENTLKRSPGINPERKVLCPGHGFLSGASWLSMPKKHYYGLINQSTQQTPIGVLTTSGNKAKYGPSVTKLFETENDIM